MEEGMEGQKINKILRYIKIFIYVAYLAFLLLFFIELEILFERIADLESNVDFLTAKTSFLEYQISFCYPND